MKLTSRPWPRAILLAGVYALGIFGIIASDDGDGDIRLGFTCDLSFRGLAPVADGTVWAGVLSQSTDGNVDSVVLLGTDGAELASFVIGPGGNDNSVRVVALAVDAPNSGDVYVGGDFAGGILRLDSDGTQDAGFVVGTGFNDRVTSIVPLPNGQLYVGGLFTAYNGISNLSGFVRLNSDGTRDPGFNPVDVSNVESVALAGLLATDDVYSGGQDSPRLERWFATGLPDNDFDPTFGAGTVFDVTPVLAGFNAGDIYIGGSFGNRILRFNADDSPDGAFNNNIVTGFDGDVLSIALSTLDRIYVGGLFTTFEGTDANGVVLLNDNGTRDFTFSIGSGFTDPNDNFAFSKVASVAQATDGTFNVFVGGGFSDYDGNAVNGIARLNSIGGLINVFAVRITVDGETCSNQTISD